MYSGISCAPKPQKIDSNQEECSDDYVHENCILPVVLIEYSENDFLDPTERITAFCGVINEFKTCLKDFTQRCVSFTKRSITDLVIAGIIRSAEIKCKPQKEQERESNFFSTRKKLWFLKTLFKKIFFQKLIIRRTVY